MRLTWRATISRARGLLMAGVLGAAPAWTPVVLAGEGTARSSPAGADRRDEPELREQIRDMVKGMRDVPFPVIIEALSEHRVQPWTGEARGVLRQIAEGVHRLIETRGIEAARMNEAGNQVEDFVIEAMRTHGLHAGRPKGESGRGRAAGYPDLEIEIEGTAFYVEVKAFSAATKDSSHRSFYLSPSADFKVTRDAVHLLIAVELNPDSGGTYRARSVRWLDLNGLRCDLKYEFNASNRDLYREQSGLVIVDAPQEPAPSTSAAPDSAPAGPLQ